MADVDPRPSDQGEPRWGDPECDEGGTILRVLHDDPVSAAAHSEAKCEAERRPAQPRGGGRGSKTGTETHHRIDRGRGVARAPKGETPG